MAEEFLLPDIGEGLTEAVIVTWHVDVGDTVSLDEPLVEIETDKAVVDIPSPYAGTVLHHGAEPDETIAVGDVLVVIGGADEAWERRSAETGTATAPPAAPPPIVGTLDGPAETGDRTEALPAVRRMARDLGVDLSGLTGSGRRGRITEDDVRRAAAGRPSRRVPMSRLRRAISDNLTRSWREIPQVTTFGSAAAEPLLEARRRMNVPLDALLIACVAPILRDMPHFNAAIDGDAIVERDYCDVGFAVETGEGLVVAVVRDADRLDRAALGEEVSRLAAGAVERRLQPEEMRGQTFTVSNIGAVGGGYGTPLVPTETSAILSVGRAEQRPVVRSGQIVVGLEFPLSLSYDHRLIDGAAGRAFMASVVASLESGGPPV